MSSEILGGGENFLKGNLGGAWDAKHGYAGAYTDLGIARRFGGSAAAYSLRDIGAMNGPVIKVRRSADDVEEDFSASQVDSGALEDWVNGKLESTLPADVATAAAAFSLRKVSSLKTIYNQSSFPASDVAPLVKNMTFNSFVGNVDGYQGKDNLIKLTMDATDGAGGSDIPRTPQVGLGLSGYQSSRTGTVTFEYYIEPDSPLVGGYWIVGNETNQYSPEGVKIIGGAWTTAVVQFVDKLGSTDHRVYTDQGRLLSIRDASVGGQAIRINRDSTSPFIHFSSFLVTATDFSFVRIRRSSDNIEVNVGFDEDEKVSLNSLVGNVNEEGGDIGITNATTLGDFLNPTYTVGTSVESASRTFNSFTSNGNDGFTATKTGGGSSTGGFPYTFATGDVISVSFDLVIADSASPTFVLSGNNMGSGSLGTGTTFTSSGSYTQELTTSSGTGTHLAFTDGNTGTFTVSNFKVTSHKAEAFVNTWYDQAGSNNAVQATAANQPKIASSGALLADANGNATLDFPNTSGTDTHRLETDFIGTNINSLSAYCVCKSDNTNTLGAASFSQPFTQGSYSSDERFFIAIDKDEANWHLGYGTGLTDLGTSVTTNQTLFSINAGTNVTSNINAVQKSTASSQDNALTRSSSFIGGHTSTDAPWDGTISELIYYNSDQSNNRFKIESNINNYYDLYTTSGNGFVSIWYDQSTSGNNCTQSSASLQPFIVDSGTFTGVFMKEISGGSEPNARNLRIDDIQTTDLGNNFGLIWVGTVDDTYSNAHSTTLVGANRNIVTQNQGTVGLNVKLSGDEFILKNETSGSANVNSGAPTFSYTAGDRVSVAGTCVGPDGDGDHTLKAYVNGATPVSNNDTLVLTDSADDLRIMASNFSNTVRRDRSTIGKVDEVIIFASNIEPDMEEVRAEINNHYNIY